MFATFALLVGGRNLCDSLKLQPTGWLRRTQPDVEVAE